MVAIVYSPFRMPKVGPIDRRIGGLFIRFGTWFNVLHLIRISSHLSKVFFFKDNPIGKWLGYVQRLADKYFMMQPRLHRFSAKNV